MQIVHGLTGHDNPAFKSVSPEIPDASANASSDTFNRAKNSYDIVSIASQREHLRAFCLTQSWQYRTGLIKPHQIISLDKHSDLPTLANYYRHQQKPLQVIDDQVATSHRVYPIRGEKHVLQTERYFSQLASPWPHLLAEPLLHNREEFAAIIEWQHKEQDVFSAIQHILMMQTDHGVLQELFSAEPMSDRMMLQLGLMIEAVVMAFAQYGCRFTLFFERYADQLWFSHIDTHHNLVTTVIDSITDDLLSTQPASANLAAKFNYQASMLSARQQDQLVNSANQQLSLRHIVLNKLQKQLDCPFGVTIAFSDDVRAALRLCIRVENVLKGRIAQF